MNKGFIAFMFGLGVSLLFGFGFMQLQKGSQEEIVVYYLQTGVYKTEQNAQNMQIKLSQLAIDSSIYECDQLYYVICAIDLNQEKLTDFETILNNNNLSSVRKEKKIISEKTAEKIKKNLLEALHNENSGNGRET